MLPVEFSSVIYCSYVQIVDLTICNILPIQEIIIFIYFNNNIYKRIIKKRRKKLSNPHQKCSDRNWTGGNGLYPPFRVE